MHRFTLGERIRVLNGTTQQNQFGRILKVSPQSGFIIVELDSGLRWPVYEHEIEKAPEKSEVT